MNGRERIQAALQGAPADRVAIAPILSLYGARLSGCPLRRYYTDPEAYADGQTLVLETFQPDMLFAPFAFAVIGEAFGSQLHGFEDQAPNVRRPAVRSAGEWEGLAIPDPDTHPLLVYFREAVRLMAARHGGEVLIAMPLPPPIDIPALVMGLEPWLETVLFDPDGTQRIMERVTPFFVRLANGLLEAGAACITAPCSFASPVVVTREIAARFARPALREAMAQLRGPMVLHHGGAPILAHLDLLAGLPNTGGFTLDPSDDPAEARRILGPGAVLLAGPLGPQLEQMATAEVERQCQAILENRREDRHFILYSAGPDIPWRTPPENIRALRRCTERQAAGCAP